MRVSRLIPMSQIQCDFLPIGPKTLALIKHIEKGGSVPPVKVQFNGKGQWKIKNGRHRFLAFKMLGIQFIPARWGELDKRKIH